MRLALGEAVPSPRHLHLQLSLHRAARRLDGSGERRPDGRVASALSPLAGGRRAAGASVKMHLVVVVVVLLGGPRMNCIATPLYLCLLTIMWTPCCYSGPPCTTSA